MNHNPKTRPSRGPDRNVFKCPLHDGHLYDAEHDVSDMACLKCGMQMEIAGRVSLQPQFPTMPIPKPL